MKQIILCVDDEKIVLETLKEQLKDAVDEDCIIEIADNGEDAIAIVDEYAQNGYSVLMVISDYIMPGMNGDELLTKIHREYPDTVNILLTGQATFEGISAIINHASLFRFIQKPWYKEDLVLSVHEGIKSYQRDQLIHHQNKLLTLKNNELLQWSSAVVEALGKALDSRDNTTSGHSKKMADFAVQLAEAVNASAMPPFEDVHFSQESIDVLYYAALLHDVGKIGVRERILLKNAKISPEQLTIIEQRVYLFVNYIQTKSHNSKLSDAEKWLIDNYKEIIKRVIIISEGSGIDDENIKFINQLRSMTFYGFEGQEQALLESDEIEALSVHRGNLTVAERKLVESHAQITYDILKDIPWPETFKEVPYLSSSHHERLDGSGYYLGLEGESLSIETRILAILDVYEALTAPDRPYRKGLSAQEAVGIIYDEAIKGKFDLALVNLLKQMVDNGEGNIHD